MACGMLDGYYVVAGGYPDEDTVEILDFATLTWAFGPTMPISVAFSSYEVYNNNLLVVGGYDGSGYIE